MIAGRNELFESERFFAGQNADVGHTDNRQAVPAFRAKRSPRTIGTDGMSRLAGAQIAGKQSVADDRSALRGNTFIVEIVMAGELYAVEFLQRGIVGDN